MSESPLGGGGAEPGHGGCAHGGCGDGDDEALSPLDILKSIEDELRCPVCLSVLQTPVIAIKCRHAFCK
jgi:hypothetical protein